MNFDDHYSSETAGQIQLIIGPMFSGKTTELLRRIRRFTIAKRRCLVIKYEADKRYSDECAATHDNYTHAAVSCSKLFDAKRKLGGLESIDVVGVDEGQFYPDLVEFCEEMANSGKVVIVSALDATFQRKPFGAVLELIPLAEKVDKFSAVCVCCQNSAAFTSRLSSETAVQLIGGSDLYISTCRRCFPNAGHIYSRMRQQDNLPSSPVLTPNTSSTCNTSSPLSSACPTSAISNKSHSATTNEQSDKENVRNVPATPDLLSACSGGEISPSKLDDRTISSDDNAYDSVNSSSPIRFSSIATHPRDPDAATSDVALLSEEMI